MERRESESIANQDLRSHQSRRCERLRGGTGVTCDWSAARATLPFARFLILSGGLNARNVAHAIAAVAPQAVDVCSGVETTPGVKDHRTIEKFIAAVRTAEC